MPFSCEYPGHLTQQERERMLSLQPKNATSLELNPFGKEKGFSHGRHNPSNRHVFKIPTCLHVEGPLVEEKGT